MIHYQFVFTENIWIDQWFANSFGSMCVQHVIISNGIYMYHCGNVHTEISSYYNYRVPWMF